LPLIIKPFTFLRPSGWQAKEEDCGLDIAFSIKSGEEESKFYLRNLIMEIATIDRDEEPLRHYKNILRNSLQEC